MFIVTPLCGVCPHNGIPLIVPIRRCWNKTKHTRCRAQLDSHSYRIPPLTLLWPVGATMAEREEKIGGMDELWLMLLLLTANGSPIVARELLHGRLGHPIDGGRKLGDGQRILGDSKTWRGLAAAVLASTLLTLAIGWPWQVGVVIGLGAMLGDSASSFIKRRLGLPSSGPAPGLDHIPESLLPLLACRSMLQLSWTQVVFLSLGFMLADMVLSRLFHRIGIRRHPH